MIFSEHQLTAVQNLLTQRYDSIFNFYFAKDIGDLCYQRPHTQQGIAFQDFLRLDCQDEMLKRYYNLNEVGRINLLAQYYARNRVLENDPPALYLTIGRTPLSKRIKRRLKRRTQTQQQDQTQPFNKSQTFLKTINTIDLATQQQANLLEDVSMETTLHDIYENNAQNVQHIKLWKGMLPLQVQDSDIQYEQQLPDSLVFDFKDLDHERILNEYNILKVANPQKIQIQSFPKGNLKTYFSSSSRQNHNATILKKSQPKDKARKTYLVKGLPNNKKAVRLDQQQLQQIGVKKQRRFIKGFQTQLNSNWQNSKKLNHLKIYPTEYNDRVYQTQSKNRNSQYYRSPKINNNQYILHSRSPQFDQRLQRIKTISNQSKWRTKQYEDLKSKAQKIQEQALRTIYRFSSKNARSTQYILPSNRQYY